MVKHNTHKILPPPFKIHDLVLVHKTAFKKNHPLPDLNKFDDRWYGPYKILRVVNENAYTLKLPPLFKHHNVINVSFIRPYRISTKFPCQHPHSLLLPPVGPDGSPSEDDTRNDETTDNSNDIEFEAESIIGCRLIQ